ncbi:unnamed protein product [Ixodes pacificus]
MSQLPRIVTSMLCVSPCDRLCSVTFCDRPQRRLQAIKTNPMPRACHVPFGRGAAPHNPAICLPHWIDGMARSVCCSTSQTIHKTQLIARGTGWHIQSRVS